MLEILGSIFAGGATGLLGAGLQRFFDWLNVKAQLERDKLKYDHEATMRDKDAAILREEWKGRLTVAQTEADAAKDVAESQAFGASMLREPERYAAGEAPKNWMGSLGWFLLACTDVLRGVVRPGLTLYLCVLVTYIWWQVRQLVSIEDLDQAAVLAIWLLVVKTILYVWTTATLWYFGTRNKQKQPGT